MIKLVAAVTLLFAQLSYGGLPPTTSKIIGDSSDVVTFKYQFPNFTGTHTGTTISLGVLSLAGGGTGSNYASNQALLNGITGATAKGTLLIGDGTNLSTAAAGFNGSFLMYDNTQTNGTRPGVLAAGSGISVNRVGDTTTIAATGTPAPNASTKSGNYTLVSSDDNILFNGTSNATFTVPNCTILGNKVFHIDMDSTSQLTIVSAVSDTFKQGYSKNTSITISEDGVGIDLVCYGGTTYYVH